MSGKGYKSSTIKKNGVDLNIGIVVSEWNSEITTKLLQSCQKTLKNSGIEVPEEFIIHVPGSFELPSGARLLLQSHKLDAVICLGCLIKGETMHDEFIAQSVANSINILSIQSGIPILFGVLTTLNQEQAAARAGGGHGDKGKEAAESAIKMALLKRQMTNPKSSIGFTS